jgi:hypothetical protein
MIERMDGMKTVSKTDDYDELLEGVTPYERRYSLPLLLTAALERLTSFSIGCLNLKESLHVERIAHWFRSFYEPDPWNEYAICSRCAGPSPFNSTLALSKSVVDQNRGRCPRCGYILSRFWADERIRLYMDSLAGQNGAFGFCTARGTEITGWIIGYEGSRSRYFPPVYFQQHALYIDVIGVLPDVRSSRAIHHFLLSLEISRAWSTDVADTVSSYKNAPVAPHATLLYLLALCHAHTLGLPSIVTRTHRAAKHVSYLLRRAGFTQLCQAPEDDNRENWVKQLQTIDRLKSRG